jgi:hypothetical protein
VPLERGFVLRGLCVLVRLGHTTGVLYIHVGLQVKFFWHYVLANILKRKLEAGLGAVAWDGVGSGLNGAFGAASVKIIISL